MAVLGSAYSGLVVLELVILGMVILGLVQVSYSITNIFHWKDSWQDQIKKSLVLWIPIVFACLSFMYTE
jgi:hypothetical protein